MKLNDRMHLSVCRRPSTILFSTKGYRHWLTFRSNYFAIMIMRSRNAYVLSFRNSANLFIRLSSSFTPEICSSSFLPARRYASAVLASSCVCPPVCLSVRLSQVGILLRRLNLGSCRQRHTIAQGLYTVSGKMCHYTFASNFAKYWSIFNILSQTDLANL